VPYFGGRLTFQVIGVIPDAEAVVVTQKTVFSITSQGPTLKEVDGFKYFSNGNMVSFLLEHVIRKENSQDAYLVLKMHLHQGGFGKTGEFQIKLEKSTSIQQLVLRYRELAQEIVKTANTKLEQTGNVNSADLINNLEFEILEKWRAA